MPIDTLGKKRRGFWRIAGKQKALILMSVPLLLYKILFSYVPLAGWAIAFKEYDSYWIRKGIMAAPWVGLDNFKKLFTGYDGEIFRRDLVNTFAHSFLSLLLGFVFTIILALMLNEVKFIGAKRVIQNLTYLPHFLSWLIVANMVSSVLASADNGGIINEILLKLHIIDRDIAFLKENTAMFYWIVAISHLWKELGWNTIIYLAAMTSIDPTLYEAAEIDGANRYRKMWNITLPCIRPTIVILLIMNVGWILDSAGFEIQYFLGTSVKKVSETIDILTLSMLQDGDYSVGIVAGMFKTVIAIVLVSAANFLAGRLGEEKLI